MAENPKKTILRFNIYFPFIILFFFLNNVGLPDGLVFTTLLAPLFYVWLITIGERYVLMKYLIVVIPFALCQIIFYPEIDYYFYFRSFTLYLMIYISIYAGVIAFRRMKSPQKIFNKIIWLNFGLTIIALIILFTPMKNLLWTTSWITADSGMVSRLRLLTYEPSYYSTLLVPFVVYAMVALVNKFNLRNLILLGILILPLALSFSFGVISALIFGIILASIYKFRMLFRNKWIVYLLFFTVIIFIVLLSTENLISLRLENIISGKDSSASVRTSQSFDVAMKIASETNLFFGAGFGQSKLIADKFFDVYWPGLNVVRITNVLATVLAEFGLVGLIFRFTLLIFLFFSTKVYLSYYRLILFSFFFIYQFTGSYPTNVAEYFIWVLSFVPIFPEFERKTDMILDNSNYVPITI